MGKRFAISLILGVALFAAAFSAQASYSSDLAKATKDGALYHANTWEARIIWYATFYSDKFRESYIEKYDQLEHSSPEEAAAFREEQERRQASGWDFFIGAYTREEYKELSSYPDSFWKIRLTTASGEEYAPIAVEHLRITPLEEEGLFPYLNRWCKAYRVTFPKVELGDKIRLTVSSPVGESTLKWKVQ